MPDQTNIIILSNGSIELLLSAITSAGWTTKRREIVSAGLLADELEFFVANRPVYQGEVSNGSPTDQNSFVKFRAEVRAWERKDNPVDMTDLQFQTCMSCLRHYSDEKKVPANLHGAQLLLAFKLSE